jgi:hypothetical protein
LVSRKDAKHRKDRKDLSPFNSQDYFTKFTGSSFSIRSRKIKFAKYGDWFIIVLPKAQPAESEPLFYFFNRTGVAAGRSDECR